MVLRMFHRGTVHHRKTRTTPKQIQHKGEPVWRFQKVKSQTMTINNRSAKFSNKIHLVILSGERWTNSSVTGQSQLSWILSFFSSHLILLVNTQKCFLLIPMLPPFPRLFGGHFLALTRLHTSVYNFSSQGPALSNKSIFLKPCHLYSCCVLQLWVSVKYH